MILYDKKIKLMVALSKFKTVRTEMLHFVQHDSPGKDYLLIHKYFTTLNMVIHEKAFVISIETLRSFRMTGKMQIV